MKIILGFMKLDLSLGEHPTATIENLNETKKNLMKSNVSHDDEKIYT